MKYLILAKHTLVNITILIVMNSEFHSHLKNIFGMKYHTHSQWQLLDLERNTDKWHLNTSGDIVPKIAEVMC